MRRSIALIAAAALLLSAVGTVSGTEPQRSPVIDPSAEPTPSVEPTQEPSAEPPAPASSAAPSEPEPAAPVDPPVVDPDPAPAVSGSDPAAPSQRGEERVDPANRWIVVLNDGTNADAAADRQGKRIGFAADRTFGHALRGYSARLDRGQVEALRGDPSVAMIVADERIGVTSQAMPTGIARVNATRSAVAKIDGVDERVDADVAIVDTGISKVSDLNVVGGYNCSTSNRALWRDVYGHGTHVAGTVGAIDNGSGVVGVAPGVRLWAVKILDDTGEGLLSWYVCGLDWIAAQRDPSDSSRPMFEAVNMSVAKWGSDDRNCGATNKDVLHAAICRLVKTGVTVVAAAGNDHSTASARVPAAYNEVITVSALADTDGKPGGLGGHRCYSWGTYDNDDSFADFSNRGSDVDIIAPGKCIWSTVPGGYKYSSGTSMAAPHVTGAVALLKSDRPGLTPSEVREALQYLGTTNWKWWTDPDSYHEKLLDVSRIGPRGDFGISAGPEAIVGEAGGRARFPITISRSATSFERVRLSATDLPAGWTATFDATSLFGFSSVASTLSVTVPSGAPQGRYDVTVVGNEHGNVHTATATVVVETDAPTAQPPVTAAKVGSQLGSSTVPTRTTWPAATDPTTAIAGYEVARSVDGGTWTAATSTTASVRSVAVQHSLGHAYRYRVRAMDAVGNWGDWASGPSVTGVLVQDRLTAVAYTGAWTRVWATYASDRTMMRTSASGTRATTTFSGRGVAVVGQTGAGYGRAQVWIDGVYRTTITFRAAATHGRMVVYSTAFGSLATHKVDLRPLGDGPVYLDAFVILR